MVISLVVNENKRTLDIELGRLKSCLVIIQDSGYSEEARTKAIGSAEMCIEFIKNNIQKYPEQEREVFRKEFNELRELSNTLSSFFVSKNKKS